MRSYLVKGIVKLDPPDPLFTLPPPLGNDPAFAFGLTDLAIGYKLSTSKHAEDNEIVIEPAIDADHNDCIIQKSPAKYLTNSAKIPELVVTGESSFHTLCDYCTV